MSRDSSNSAAVNVPADTQNFDTLMLDDGTTHTVYRADNGVYYYVDFDTQEWKEAPETWLKEGVLESEKEAILGRRSSAKDRRGGGGGGGRGRSGASSSTGTGGARELEEDERQGLYHDKATGKVRALHSIAIYTTANNN